MSLSNRWINGKWEVWSEVIGGDVTKFKGFKKRTNAEGNRIVAMILAPFNFTILNETNANTVVITECHNGSLDD